MGHNDHLFGLILIWVAKQPDLSNIWQYIIALDPTPCVLVFKPHTWWQILDANRFIWRRFFWLAHRYFGIPFLAWLFPCLKVVYLSSPIFIEYITAILSLICTSIVSNDFSFVNIWKSHILLQVNPKCHMERLLLLWPNQAFDLLLKYHWINLMQLFGGLIGLNTGT